MNTVSGTTNTLADSKAALRTQADSLVKQGSAEDFDKFLLLMTAQLRQQDPLNPTDATEFVAQLATFSSVEQSIKSNEKLDRLIAATGALADQGAATLIGKTVESAAGRVVAGGQPVGFAYEPVGDATRIVAQVRDADDRLLREIPLALGTGRLQDLWDGLDQDGAPVTAGEQTILVLQYRDQDLLQHGPAIIESRVTEVRMEPEGPRFVLENGTVLMAAELRAVRADAAAGLSDPASENR